MHFVTALLLEAGETSSSSGDLWKWLNFAILAGVLGYLIKKNLGPVLVTRSEQIRTGLAAGEKARAEAEARASAVTAKLKNLDQAIAEMKAAARNERERESERLKRDTQSELTRIARQSELEIESAGKLAMLEVQRHAAKLAIDLAEQKVRARMSQDTQAALIGNFIGDIAAGTVKVSSGRE